VRAAVYSSGAACPGVRRWGAPRAQAGYHPQFVPESPPVINLIRRILLGRPLATSRMEHEKVGQFGGLAVFAADAMSSVAYGPEEVMLLLATAGAFGLTYMVPIGIALAVLISIVATSYRQTVTEYPSGGGPTSWPTRTWGAAGAHRRRRAAHRTTS